MTSDILSKAYMWVKFQFYGDFCGCETLFGSLDTKLLKYLTDSNRVVSSEFPTASKRIKFQLCRFLQVTFLESSYVGENKILEGISLAERYSIQFP